MKTDRGKVQTLYKDRNHCVLDDLKRGLYRSVLDSFEVYGKKIQEAHPVPEKDSPLAKYATEEILDEKCVTADGQPFYMEIFRPVISTDRMLPVIVDIHGGGFVREDRRYNRQYMRALASRGFLVFSFDYILSDDTSITRELKDICSIIGVISVRMKDFKTDPSRVFMTGESAGAYLALYIAAMSKSEKLRDTVGCGVPALEFTALGLNSGMFYINRCDLSGWVLSRFECGMSKEEREFQRYIDPECDEVIKNIPPVFLTTSRGDYLNDYTISYHEALKKAGKRSRLVYRGSSDLTHGFLSLMPNIPECIDVIDMMTEWFEGDKINGIYEAGKLSGIDPTYVNEDCCGIGCDMLPCAAEDEIETGKKPAVLPDEIVKRLESGEIIEQKTWKFIKELNSYSEDRLEAIALTDCSRDYTYRQMFILWENYAKVFTALGISGDRHSRAAMTGTCAAEAISAFFALNMTGASVSMIGVENFNDAESWKNTVLKEGITDIILTDIDVHPGFVRKLARDKDSLGIRNIIVLNIAVHSGEQFSWEDVRAHRRKRDRIRKIGGLLFMEDLLNEYKTQPVSPCKEEIDDAAVILHTSGTVSGIHKPVPHSDAGINEAVSRIVRDDRFADLMGRAVTCSNLDMSASFSFVDQILLILAFGGRLHVFPAEKPGLRLIMSLIDNNANLIFFAGMTFELLEKLPVRLDFSSFEHIIAGGSYVSADTKKRADRYLRRCGAKSNLMIGYGTSEAGAACILAPPGREDESIGYPLPGVKVKLYDENDGKYYDIEDGPRTGVLHIASRSVSGGRIDDTVFFGLEDIDGEKYLNTYDLVRVGEDGALYYAGRMNKFFVNNEGVRFDAGLVETAVSAEPGIEACGLAPEYKKVLHDTVPVLYVQTAGSERDSVRIARDALVNVFVRDDVIKESNLPSICVITDSIPLNQMGKVDTYRIGMGETSGKRFAVVPVRMNGALRSVDLAPLGDDIMSDFGFGVPEELEDTVNKMKALLGEV